MLALAAGHTYIDLLRVMPGLTIVFASAGHGVDHFGFKRCGLDDGVWVDQQGLGSSDSVPMSGRETLSLSAKQ